MMARVSLVLLSAALAAAAGEKPKLSFVKDIVPIFTKSGCANSNCHGSIRGQAGFKLSLFGYEPDLDFDAIVKNQDGRRINRSDPSKSLILMKPTFSMPHGGGERFKVGSLEYEAILDWVRDGATYDSAGSPRDAGRNHPDRPRHETPAERDRHIHRRHERRSNAQSAVHA
jgi:hypothetical protein